MLTVSDEVLVFRMSRRTSGSAEWLPASRLLVHVGDGASAVPAHLSWVTEDGGQSAVGFSPDMASCYGHRRTTGGEVMEVCGERDDRREYPEMDLVSVRASAEHRDAGEVAKNLVDASTNIWFAPHNRASLEFRLPEPIAVDRYVLTSADDAPDRDPSAWTLRGSADGHLWRILDIRSGQTFADRHQSTMYWIAEPGSYDHYRLDITGNNDSPHLQLEAVRFRADGSGGFVGYRRRAGHAPAAYRGIRLAQASPDMPAEPLPEDAPALPRARPATSTPGFPPSTLDFEGVPIWLSELAEEPHHVLPSNRTITSPANPTTTSVCAPSAPLPACPALRRLPPNPATGHTFRLTLSPPRGR